MSMNYRCYKCIHKTAYPGGWPCGICRAGHDQFEMESKEALNSFYGVDAFRKVKEEKMYKDIRFRVEGISVDQRGISAIVSSKPGITVEMTVDGIDLDVRGSGAALYAELENRLNYPHYGIPRIKNVIFNEPATIVFWADGTKTVVKCQEGDIFDPEKGLTMAITKKAFGNKGNYCNEIKKWTEPYYEKHANDKCVYPSIPVFTRFFNEPSRLSELIEQKLNDILNKKEETDGK